MKNTSKLSHLLASDSILFKTGNVVGLNALNKNVGQSVSEEIEICLNSTIDKWIEKGENQKTNKNEDLLVVEGQLMNTVKEDERADMKITVKVFINSESNASAKEALEQTLTAMGVKSVETVILSVSPGNSENVSYIDIIKNYWIELEDFVSCGVVGSLGISDLNLEQLTVFYDWAKVKPATHQVNLHICCVIPPEMASFAKAHDIQLFTHADPTEILPKKSIDRIFQSKFAFESQNGAATNNSVNPQNDAEITHSCSFSKNLNLSWLTRYLVLIDCRGIINSKGYIAKLNNKI